MDVAASLVGFIGLTGQVTQGCNYLWELFGDAKDAPHIVQKISDNLSVIQPALLTIRASFVTSQAASQSLSELPDPTLALKNCESAIAELKAFVDRHGAVRKQTSTAHQNPLTTPPPVTSLPETSIFRQGWQRLDVAWKAKTISKLAARLEEAKSSLLVVLANINLILGQHQETLAQETNLAQKQLQDALRASAQIGADTKAIALGLRTDTHVGLSQMMLANEANTTNLNKLGEYAREIKASSRVTEDMICTLSVDFKDKIGAWSTASMKPLIEEAMAKVLEQYMAALSKPMEGPESPSFASSSATTTTNTGQAQLVPVNSTGQLTSDTSMMQVANTSTAHKSPVSATKRGPKRQRRSVTTVNLWFVRIQITTAVTQQADHTAPEDFGPLLLYAKPTQISIFPNLRFLKTGACFQFGDSKPGIYHPTWDNRLRVFHTHSRNSRVHRVIKEADYAQFREMLQNGEATVHDMVGDCSLFESVTEAIYSDIMSYAKHTERLMLIAQLLTSSGVDCGAGVSMVYCSAALTYRPEEGVKDHLRSLFRMIVSHSESNPFNEWIVREIDVDEFQTVAPMALQQDEWELLEFEKEVEAVWGKGSWDYVITGVLPIKEARSATEARPTRIEWAQWQEQQWLQLPFLLRRDREHCAQYFGKRFVKEYWPQLYWRDQRPSFWRSREACQKLFGDSFMRYEWMKLYWEAEVPQFWNSSEECRKFFGDSFDEFKWAKLCWQVKRPDFWHSWEACRAFFGVRFVAYVWRNLLQVQAFDWAEGKGAWDFGARRFGSWGKVDWSVKDSRKDWVAAMVERWQSEEEDLRHSRAHCIKQYGTNFVRDQLPKLLREFDGLSENEITDLTQDGPDLEPSSLLSNSVRSKYDDSDDEADEEDEEDGYETAEED